jgi:YVTN family beta-propeller protein
VSGLTPRAASGQVFAELAPTLYVSNGRGGTVTPIATATNTAGTPIEVGDGPYAIALKP